MRIPIPVRGSPVRHRSLLRGFVVIGSGGWEREVGRSSPSIVMSRSGNRRGANYRNLKPFLLFIHSINSSKPLFQQLQRRTQAPLLFRRDPRPQQDTAAAAQPRPLTSVTAPRNPCAGTLALRPSLKTPRPTYLLTSRTCAFLATLRPAWVGSLQAPRPAAVPRDIPCGHGVRPRDRTLVSVKFGPAVCMGSSLAPPRAPTMLLFIAEKKLFSHIF